MNKIVVYTAIYGNYAKLRDAIPSKGCDFVCFTDDPNLKSDTWDVRYIEGFSNDPRRNAKIYKILPHKYFKEYDYSMWVDSSHVPYDAATFVSACLNKHNIAVFKHYNRKCVYQELKACIKQKKDNKYTMQAQIQKYKDEGYPTNNGLSTCSVILRKHNDSNVIKTMEDWWGEIERHSSRDQLSFDYVIYKNKLPLNVIKKHIRHNPFFDVLTHKLPNKKDRIYKSRKYIIDCGGWQGDSVNKLRKKYDPKGNHICHTFEPNDYFIPYYSKFKNHVLHTKAVWIYDGEIDFHLQKEHAAKKHVGSSIFGRDIKPNVREESIKVQCIDFSKWILDTFNINDYIILKLDIEGAEYKVLEKMLDDGSMNYINELYVELHRKKCNDLITKEDAIKLAQRIRRIIPLGPWR